MFEQIAVGLGLVCSTTVIHAVFMVAGVRWEDRRRSSRNRELGELGKALSVSLFTAWMFLGVFLEAFLWAAFYVYHPAITTLPDMQTAFYFSMVTFTAVGYGDVVLVGPWRVVASIEAANGVLIFGWTTALLFYYIQRVYARR